MKTRILAAVVLLPALLGIVLFAPKLCTAVLFGLLAAIGSYELLKSLGHKKQLGLVLLTGLCALSVPIWCYFGMSYLWGLLGVLLFSAGLFALLLYSQGKLPVAALTGALLGGLIIPFLLSSLIRLFRQELGRYYILIPFVLAFLSDTGAYFTGRAFGRHKLAPVISPNKTVEGVIGGVLGAIAGMALYCLILQQCFNLEVNYLYAAIYGLLGSLAGVFGDLSFSAVKRQVGIKDYGNLIPGHGGVLDRFDSMTMVAPLAEALVILIPVVI